MGASYRAKRPRASPWWQCIQACLDDFLANYTIRYYGRYSNKRRSYLRVRGGTTSVSSAGVGNDASPGQVHLLTPAQPRRRRSWRALIVRIWGADPLRCPCCSGVMHKIGVVKRPDTIRAILTRLGLLEGASAIPPAQAPPPSSKTRLWGVDTWDGRFVAFEPGWELAGIPTQRLTPSPRERHLTYTLVDCEQATAEYTEAEPSQTHGWAARTKHRDDGLLLVFDADPPPPDNEPVFWSD